ncbi:MGMT family protein [Euzebya tangerina]|uniref:MGMT family protein n=1 Tax=Euzebya tangerina TaxID=591198 RepID=UPI00196B1FEC|nr:MGMT family protein [Euzebya tangerina]
MTSDPPHLTEFARSVYAAIRTVPPGTCASYGEIAQEAGRPGAARGVGSILAQSGGADLPWWRIIRADGSLPKGADQEGRLRAEGVTIINGRVRMT